MSSEAFVFTREKPALPEEGEFSDGRFPFVVRRTDDRDARALREAGIDGSKLPWVVEVSVSGEWYDAFVQGGSIIARRSGGGALWSPRWPSAQPVAPGDAPSARSLFSEAERGFDEADFEDDDLE